MSNHSTARRSGTESVPCELSVAGGRLDGARMNVSSGRWLKLGTAIDSDVVLRDPTVSPAHACLRVVADDHQELMLDVEPLVDGLEVGGETLAVGKVHRLPLAPIRMGSLELSVRAESETPADLAAATRSVDDSTSPSSPSSLSSLSSAGSSGTVETQEGGDSAFAAAEAGEPAGAEAGDEADAEPDTEADTGQSADDALTDAGVIAGAPALHDDEANTVAVMPEPVPVANNASVVLGLPAAGRQASRSRWLRFGGAALVSVVLASVAVASLVSREGPEPEPSAQASIIELLAAALPDVSVTEEPSGLRVSGAVATREDAMLLNELLMSATVPVENDTVVIAELLDGVSDVFRVHGLEATVVSAGGRDVEVRSRTADIQTLTAVRETIAKDVPDVGELFIKNSLPATPAVSKPVYASAPVEVQGKRVAMVVSDPPGYVVTEDKSRYYTGALLPSGHRITAVENGRVSLVKDGRTTVLDF